MYFVISLSLLLCCYFLSKLKSKYKKCLIVCNTVIAIIYIIWRITVIPVDSIASFVLGLLLYGAELIGLLQFFTFQFLFIKPYQVEEMNLDVYDKSYPSVDVLICTYNEPISILEKTIVGAIGISYKYGLKTVNVCDDGKRESVRELCNKYNVNWITRESNEGAKAGNINNALKYLKGDLFAVFDADMIADKTFLEKTAGYFFDKNTAFVQTPQCYYNKDMYQHNLKKNIPNEQDFFMRDVQEARASVNAVLHVGTNAVFRRNYIDEIGGYPTCSITEDMAVGMKLQAKGYDSVFINEVLALGLSAETYDDLVSQRDRWCRGNLQVFAKFNPIFEKGLTVAQKIAYVDGVLYWFSSVQKMIYVIAPLIYLLVGIPLLNSNISELMTMFIPFFMGEVIIFKSLSPKTRNIKWSHYYEISMAPHISFSIFKQLFSFKSIFNVTPKDNKVNKGYYQYKVAAPNIFLFFLSVLAVINGISKIGSSGFNISAIIINLSWCLYNAIGMIVSLVVAYQRPINDNEEMVSCDGNLKCFIKYDEDKYICNIIDISEKAARLKINNGINNIKRANVVKLDTDILSDVKCKIIRSYKDEIVIRFNRLTKEESMIIINYYISNIKPYYKVNKKPIYIKRKTKEIKI